MANLSADERAASLRSCVKENEAAKDLDFEEPLACETGCTNSSAGTIEPTARATFMARYRGSTVPVDPDAFDVPVVDYDFSKATTPGALIEMARRGLHGHEVCRGRSILNDMRSTINAVDGDPAQVTNWLSFPPLVRYRHCGFFVEAVKRKMFNVVSTTCGTLDRDIARAYKTTTTAV